MRMLLLYPRVVVLSVDLVKFRNDVAHFIAASVCSWRSGG